MAEQLRLRPVDVGREFNRSAAWVKLLESEIAADTYSLAMAKKWIDDHS